jgi:hypothetical protein
MNCWLKISGTVAAILLWTTSATAGVTVSSELSAQSLRATDTLVLRVTARWAGGEELFRFATPQPAANPHLRLAGQSTHGGARLVEGEFSSEKIWLFNFVCTMPGSTEVAPPVVIYTNTETEVVDSVQGSPLALAIGPAPAPPFDYGRMWPYLLGLVLVGFAIYILARFLQVRAQRAKTRELHQTPEEQAEALLEELRPLKREDRCEQFYTDLEKIVLGLWEARVGRRLTGKTPGEVAAILQESGVDPAAIAEVEGALTDCHTVRFGGGRVSVQSMESSFGTVAAWVKPSPGT